MIELILLAYQWENGIISKNFLSGKKEINQRSKCQKEKKYICLLRGEGFARYDTKTQKS